MIEETYVSFDIAKLLKEKGFGECSTSYISEDGDIFPTPLVKRKEHYPAPTQQMAMRWLREEKNIVITIDYNDDVDCEQNERWGFSIYSPDRKIDLATYPTYEEAVEAALKYCLTNFI